MPGPAGVSSISAPHSPPRTDSMPMSAMPDAIASGLRTSGRAAAAGITGRAAIRSTRTSLMATATTMASAGVMASSPRRGSTPLARAGSGLSIAAVSPIARALCARTPSTVSIAYPRPVRADMALAMISAAVRIIGRIGRIGRLRDRANATPRIAACPVASPKWAMRRQTTKQPSGVAVRATPSPARSARIRKSSSIGQGFRDRETGRDHGHACGCVRGDRVPTRLWCRIRTGRDFRAR